MERGNDWAQGVFIEHIRETQKNDEKIVFKLLMRNLHKFKKKAGDWRHDSSPALSLAPTAVFTTNPREQHNRMQIMLFVISPEMVKNRRDGRTSVRTQIEHLSPKSYLLHYDLVPTGNNKALDILNSIKVPESVISSRNGASFFLLKYLKTYSPKFKRSTFSKFKKEFNKKIITETSCVHKSIIITLYETKEDFIISVHNKKTPDLFYVMKI
jgi:hypothetical protein